MGQVRTGAWPLLNGKTEMRGGGGGVLKCCPSEFSHRLETSHSVFCQILAVACKLHLLS